jgi:hypothetical protein
MRRVFWLAVGAAAGVYAVRRIERARESLTPEQLAGRAGERAAAAGGAARSFVAEVRAATRRRDAELREALGIDGSGVPTGADAQRVAELLGGKGPADRAHLVAPPTRPLAAVPGTAPEAAHVPRPGAS